MIKSPNYFINDEEAVVKANKVAKQKDPLYAGVLSVKDFDPIVHEVLDTNAFKRLYEVYQGGLKGDKIRKYELPGTHTRGIHSRNVGLLANHFIQNDRNLIADRVHLVLGGLLHDVGHLAYSHLGEDVTGLDHKELTEEIILHDEELHRIWQRYGIDPKVVMSLALDKMPGNPVSVPRGQGILSLDHLSNIFLDLYVRTGDVQAKKLANQLLNALYLSDDGVITLKREFAYLKPLIIQYSLKHNTDVIFDKKELLYNQVGYAVLRQFIDAGVLSKNDFKGSQRNITKLLSTPLIEEIKNPELTDLLLNSIKRLTPKQIDRIVRKVDFDEEVDSREFSELGIDLCSKNLEKTYITGTAVEGQDAPMFHVEDKETYSGTAIVKEKSTEDSPIISLDKDLYFNENMEFLDSNPTSLTSFLLFPSVREQLLAQTSSIDSLKKAKQDLPGKYLFSLEKACKMSNEE